VPNKDPNKYTWEPLHVWSEPSPGNRLAWKREPWRHAKLAAFPCFLWILSAIFLLQGDRIAKQIFGVGTILAIGLAFLTWLTTFFARSVALYDDRLTTTRTAKSGSSVVVLFAEILSVDIESRTPGFWITIQTEKGKQIVILARDKSDCDKFNALLNAYHAQDHFPEPPLRAVH